MARRSREEDFLSDIEFMEVLLGNPILNGISSDIDSASNGHGPTDMLEDVLKRATL